MQKGFASIHVFLGLLLVIIVGLVLYYTNNSQQKVASLNNESTPVITSTPTTSIVNQIPTPTPIPFVKKEDLSSENTYKLVCFDRMEIGDNKPNFDWMDKLRNLLPKESQLVSLCHNQDLNKAVVVTELPGTQRSYPIEFSVYDSKENSIGSLTRTTGSYLSSCEKIETWTKTGNIYYKCGAEDGGWAISSTYRINLSDFNKKGVVEKCYSSRGKISCTNYCETSSDCKQSYFCDLETNSCVQACKTDNDCAGGICKPLGNSLVCKYT